MLLFFETDMKMIGMSSASFLVSEVGLNIEHMFTSIIKNIQKSIIGFGINVNQMQFPKNLKDIATSLKLEFGKNINRTALIKSLITQLDHQYKNFQNNKTQALIDSWTKNTNFFGKTISLKKGNQSFTGKAIRLDSKGRLVILNHFGVEEAFDSGEVRIK